MMQEIKINPAELVDHDSETRIQSLIEFPDSSKMRVVFLTGLFSDFVEYRISDAEL